MSEYWWIITIVGPILLLAALIWAFTRNRGSKVSEEASDRAAHRLRDEIDREDEANEVSR
ncbi:MAG: hypothetical protein H7X93_04425 [Sphingomonadaceae bacterium]|nr:hypothetical protein [Sphingomonadaceae bacterium]